MNSYIVKITLAACCALSACATTSTSNVKELQEHNTTQSNPEKPVGVLLLGDAGYHLKYVKNKANNPRSTQDYLQRYRKYLKDKGAPNIEAELPNYHVFTDTGHTVLDSGLHSVASAIEQFCGADHPCDFGLLMGDNIYPRGATLGVDGHLDAKRFDDIFVAPYTRFFKNNPAFQFDAVMGNHDWLTSTGGALAQLKFLEKHNNYYMDGFSYVRRHQTTAGNIDVFAIDTYLILSTEEVLRAKLDSDGKPITTNKKQSFKPWARDFAKSYKDQISWLREAMKKSDADWKIVTAHHPLWSSSGSKFQQGRVLRSLLLPTLCDYADIYVAGHDHTLEIHEQSCADFSTTNTTTLPHIVSGTGSKQRPINHKFAKHQNEFNPDFKSVWAKGMIWGFGHLELSTEDATLRFLQTDKGDDNSKQKFEYTFKRRTKSS